MINSDLNNNEEHSLSETHKVPFDLNTFKYVPVSQAAEIPGKLKPELIAILKDAGAIINGGNL